MIRLNAFFTLKNTADADKVLALAKELIDYSRKDEGNVAYDIFCSGTNPKVMMFCETWKDRPCSISTLSRNTSLVWCLPSRLTPRAD